MTSFFILLAAISVKFKLLLCDLRDFGVGLALVAGVHGGMRFYLGDVGTGIGQCITCGGCWIWSIIDWVNYERIVDEKNRNAGWTGQTQTTTTVTYQTQPQVVYQQPPQGQVMYVQTQPQPMMYQSPPPQQQQAPPPQQPKATSGVWKTNNS